MSDHILADEPAAVHHTAVSQEPPQAEPVRVELIPVHPIAPHHQHGDTRIRIYSHSSLLFWWPVWVVGYVMAAITFWHGKEQQSVESAGQVLEWVHPGNNLGVIYFLTLYLIIMITNFSVRGLASGMVLMGGALLTVIVA